MLPSDIERTSIVLGRLFWACVGAGGYHLFVLLGRLSGAA